MYDNLPYQYPSGEYYPNRNIYYSRPGQELAYMKGLLMRLRGQKADFLIDGREGIFRGLVILKIEDDVVITEAENEICFIPIRDISTLFISKNLAKKYFGIR